VNALDFHVEQTSCQFLLQLQPFNAIIAGKELMNWNPKIPPWLVRRLSVAIL
jgi:hypothetical protein